MVRACKTIHMQVRAITMSRAELDLVVRIAGIALLIAAPRISVSHNFPPAPAQQPRAVGTIGFTRFFDLPTADETWESSAAYVVDADGADLHRVADELGRSQFAEWSPDGR